MIWVGRLKELDVWWSWTCDGTGMLAFGTPGWVLNSEPQLYAPFCIFYCFTQGLNATNDSTLNHAFLARGGESGFLKLSIGGRFLRFLFCFIHCIHSNPLPLRNGRHCGYFPSIPQPQNPSASPPVSYGCHIPSCKTCDLRRFGDRCASLSCACTKHAHTDGTFSPFVKTTSYVRHRFAFSPRPPLNFHFDSVWHVCSGAGSLRMQATGCSRAESQGWEF